MTQKVYLSKTESGVTGLFTNGMLVWSLPPDVELDDVTLALFAERYGFEYDPTKRNLEGKQQAEIYKVRSDSDPDRFYLVDVTNKRCTCPSYEYRGGPCKHMKLVEGL